MPNHYKKRTTTASANLVYKKKNTQHRKGVVAKSFKKAYQKMAPSKENRIAWTKTDMSTTEATNRFTAIALTQIVAGPQMNQRLRTNIFCSYLRLRGTIQNNSSNKTRFMRIMVVQPKSVTTAADTIDWDNLFLTATWVPTGLTGLQSDGRHRINLEVFRPFYDKTIKIPPESEGSISIQRTIKLGRLIDYGYANALNTVPLNGHLYCLAIIFEGDNTLTTSTVVFSLEARMFFKDSSKNNYRF